MNKLKAKVSKLYRSLLESIAFYPGWIALCFLILAILMLILDDSSIGKSLKNQMHWLRLKDATTARSIASSIVSSIISLAVFSFSMVMIILNQTASQMSNRILDKLIGNRFQQVVLGVYIGTIVYALFLLSNIRDIDSGLYIPALSTYLLILLTIIDIFLFIYFLHYITQTVKYAVVIRRIKEETLAVLKENYSQCNKTISGVFNPKQDLKADITGIYEGFNKKNLVAFCNTHNLVCKEVIQKGEFIHKGDVVIQLDEPINDERLNELNSLIYISQQERVSLNYFYGFRQITEVALKALSPGINDPATAVQCLRALDEMLHALISHPIGNILSDDDGKERVHINTISEDEVFLQSIFPIWDYGKEDRIVQKEMKRIVHYFSNKANLPCLAVLTKDLNKIC